MRRFIGLFMILSLLIPMWYVQAGGDEELTLGEPIQGELSEDGEIDTFTYQGSEGEAVVITSTAESVAQLDTLLQLFDPDGDLIAENDDDINTLNSRIESTLPVDGEYTIVVSSFAGSTSGAYELLIDTPSEADTDTDADEVDGNSEDTDTEDDDTGSSNDREVEETTDATTEDEEATESTDDDVSDSGQSETTSIVYGDVVESELVAGGTKDFIFEGAEGDLITVETSGDFDGYITLLDSDGNPLAEDDDSGELLMPTLEEVLLPQDDTYTLRMRGFNEDNFGEFTLSLELTNSGLTVSSETELTVGQITSGFLGAGETKTYTFTVESNEFISIDVRAEFDGVMQLYGPDGTLLEEDDDDGLGLNPVIRDLEIIESGTYEVVLGTFDNTGSGEYEILFTIFSVQDPLPISYGVPVEGAIFPGERAVYVLTATEGDQVTIEVASEFDAYLEVYDPNIEYLTFDDDSGGDLQPLLEDFIIPQSGDYYLYLDGFDRFSTGDFTLSVTLNDTEAEVAEQPSSSSEGSSITYGEAVTGEMVDGESIPYRFVAAANDVISVTVDASFDGVMQLFNPDGEIVATDDDGGVGLNPEFENIVLVEAGEYLLVLSGFDSAANGTFTLTLTADTTTASTDDPDTPPEVETQIITIAEQPILESLVTGEPSEFVLNANAGDVISIAVYPTDLSSDLDLYIEVYDPDGALLVADDDSGAGVNPLLTGLELPAEGTYRLVVQSFFGDQAGDFVIALADGVAYPAPNGELATALPLTEGVAQVESIPAGTLYSIEAVADDQLNTNAALRLYTPDGALETVLSVEAPYIIPQDGVYLLLAFSDFENVEITLGTGVEATVTQAGEVVVGLPAGNTIQDNETQVWKFIPLYDGEYTIEVLAGDTTSPYDPLVTIRDAAGNVLAQDDDGGEGFNARIETLDLTGGDAIQVEVSSFAGQSAGDYVLVVAAESQEIPEAVSGGGVIINEPIGNTINAPAQIVKFTLQVDEKTTYDLAITGLQLPYIELYDVDGNLVNRAVGTLKDITLDSGTYTIQVYDRLNQTGAFTLTVSD